MEWLTSHWFLLTILSIATVFSFAYLFAFHRKSLNAKWYEFLVVSILHTVFGVFCVMFFAMLETGFDTKSIGNLSIYGGFFFMPLFYAIYAIIKKLPFSRVFDIFVVPLALTLFLARVSCIKGGCCNGILIPGTNIHVPTREMELVFYGTFIIFNFKWINDGSSKGKVYPLFLLSYGIFRFICEFLRESRGDNIFDISHVWSILAIIIGTVILLVPTIKNKKLKESNKEG